VRDNVISSLQYSADVEGNNDDGTPDGSGEVEPLSIAGDGHKSEEVGAEKKVNTEMCTEAECMGSP